jgi:hypothetical protein
VSDYNGGIDRERLDMYQIAAAFLTDEATAEVSRGKYPNTDVMIEVNDPKTSFSFAWFSRYEDVEELLTKFYVTQYHVGFQFEGMSIFSKSGKAMDALRIALESL